MENNIPECQSEVKDWKVQISREKLWKLSFRRSTVVNDFCTRKMKIQKYVFDCRSLVWSEIAKKLTTQISREKLRKPILRRLTVVNDFCTRKMKIHKSTFDCRSTARSEPARKLTVQNKCRNKVAKENCIGPKWESVVLHSAFRNP